MSTGAERAALRAEIAHDLKNPLSVIIGYAGLMSTRPDEESRVEAARAIVEAAERLSAELDLVLARLLPD